MSRSVLERQALRECFRVYSEHPERIGVLCNGLRAGNDKFLLGFAEASEMILPGPIENDMIYFLSSISCCLFFITEREPPFQLTLEECWEGKNLDYFSDLEILLAAGFWVPCSSRMEWLEELRLARTEPTFFLPRIPNSANIVNRPVEPNPACGRTETVTGEHEEDIEYLYCYGTVTECCLLSSSEIQRIIRMNRGGRNGRLVRNPWTGNFMSRELIQRCRDLAEYLEDNELLQCLPDPRFSPRSDEY